MDLSEVAGLLQALHDLPVGESVAIAKVSQNRFRVSDLYRPSKKQPSKKKPATTKVMPLPRRTSTRRATKPPPSPIDEERTTATKPPPSLVRSPIGKGSPRAKPKPTGSATPLKAEIEDEYFIHDFEMSQDVNRVLSKEYEYQYY